MHQCAFFCPSFVHAVVMNNIQAATITAANTKLRIFPLCTSDLLISRENRARWGGPWLSAEEYLLWLVWARRAVSSSTACNSPEETGRVCEASTVEACVDLMRCKYTTRKSAKHSSTLRVRNASKRYWSAVSLSFLLGPFVSSKIPDSVWKITAPLCSSWIRLFRIKTLTRSVEKTYTFMST